MSPMPPPRRFRGTVMDKVVITGGTGFIGRSLSVLLLDHGYEVICLTRDVDRAAMVLDPRVRPVVWGGVNHSGWRRELEGASAVVNLAGSSIGEGRWTKSNKQRILGSRIKAGQTVAEAVRLARDKPRALIQASAVGFYPHRSDQVFSEDSAGGEGFLSGVCRDWEDSTRAVESLGVRRVIIRTGLVLGRGGLLKRMSQPMRFFLGGPLASGRQWMSWIHIRDVAEAVRFLLEGDRAGAFNITSPRPVRNRELCRALSSVLKRPCWLPVPAPLLKLIFGRMAEEIILASQRVAPGRLEEAGFSFRFPGIEEALMDIFGG
jgi:uncharacterized protein (TIGR01777 family)